MCLHTGALVEDTPEYLSLNAARICWHRPVTRQCILPCRPRTSLMRAFCSCFMSYHLHVVNSLHPFCSPGRPFSQFGFVTFHSSPFEVIDAWVCSILLDSLAPVFAFCCCYGPLFLVHATFMVFMRVSFFCLLHLPHALMSYSLDCYQSAAGVCR